MDIALAGKIGIIESIEQDYEGKVQVAIVMDDDPGKDLGMLRQPGHRFFFSVEEMEADMTPPRILIACIGNIFLGDDGFGTEVARRLASRPLPAGVAVKDFGIRGLDLAYALLEPYDLVVMVDACPLGGRPGTIYVLEPDPEEWKLPQDGSPQFEAHAMNPISVLRMVKSMGGIPGRLLIVGCEPANVGSDEEGYMGLTEPVQAAIDDAIVMIEAQVSKVLSRESELQPH